MREILAIASFAVAVIGGLVAIFSNHRDRQTTGSILAGVFLISFFINVSRESRVILQLSCLVAFALGILGGLVAVFTGNEKTRTGSIIIGIISLATSIFILFAYLDFI